MLLRISIKIQEITSIGKDVEKREPYSLLMKIKLVHHYGKHVWRFKNLTIIKVRSKCSTAGYLSEKYQNTYSNRYAYFYVYCNVTYNYQDMQHPSVC